MRPKLQIIGQETKIHLTAADVTDRNTEYCDQARQSGLSDDADISAYDVG